LQQRPTLFPYTTLFRSIDGNEFPVEISLSFAEEEGEPRFMAFVTDITQRKRVEEAALRAEALHSVALLANAAAHEINNPLTAVRSEEHTSELQSRFDLV